MKVLLDTHVVLWWFDDINKVSDVARDLIADPQNQVIVSAVVAWEIAIKRSLGKLDCPDDLLQRIQDSRFELLPVTFDHALAIESLPSHHRDPFDRLLICQAMSEEATLITRDEWFANYSVNLIKA